eukprot:c21246_g1_i1.p1 GENE.c21246_g1_i1~~c21246_g1_i1.p1  ORF type:complete len:757 (-),score=233.91 c21246_g1_i1:71-2341(-)
MIRVHLYDVNCPVFDLLKYNGGIDMTTFADPESLIEDLSIKIQADIGFLFLSCGTKVDQTLMENGMTIFYSIDSEKSKNKFVDQEKTFEFQTNEPYGFKYDDNLIITSVTGQALAVGVKIGDKLLKIQGKDINSTQNIIDTTSQPVSSLEFTFQTKKSLFHSRNRSHVVLTNNSNKTQAHVSKTVDQVSIKSQAESLKSEINAQNTLLNTLSQLYSILTENADYKKAEVVTFIQQSPDLFLYDHENQLIDLVKGSKDLQERIEELDFDIKLLKQVIQQNENIYKNLINAGSNSLEMEKAISSNSTSTIKGRGRGETFGQSKNETELKCFIDSINDDKNECLIILTKTHNNKICADNIYGGTMKGFITCFTENSVLFHSMVDVILLTYRSFVTPTVLFEMVSSKYHSQVQVLNFDEKTQTNLIRLNVLNFIKHWLNHFPEDFTPSSSLPRMLSHFITSLQSNDETKKFISLLDQPIARMLEITHSSSSSSSSNYFQEQTKKIFQRVSRKSFFRISFKDPILLYANATEIAEQLTLLSHQICCDIKLTEFKNWTDARLHDEAPNIKRIIDHFNTVSYWVQTAILLEETPKMRADVISKFIQIAKHCFSLKNFNDTRAIVASFISPPIIRLKKTWPQVELKYDEMDAFFSSNKNYRTYREALELVQPPFVPFIGIFLTDLIYIDQANPTFLVHEGKDLINFQKCRQLYKAIKHIRLSQQTKYDIIQKEELSIYFSQIKCEKTEFELVELSTKLEPKEEK